MMPAFVGYVARFGALSDCHSEAEMLEVLKDYLGRYAKETHVSMDHRIWQKRRSWNCCDAATRLRRGRISARDHWAAYCEQKPRTERRSTC